MPKPIKPNVVNAVVAELLAGGSRAAIAKQCGVGEATVARISKANGLTKRKLRFDVSRRFCLRLDEKELDTLDALVAYESETHGRTTHSALIRKLVKRAAKSMERKKANARTS